MCAFASVSWKEEQLKEVKYGLFSILESFPVRQETILLDGFVSVFMHLLLLFLLFRVLYLSLPERFLQYFTSEMYL